MTAFVVIVPARLASTRLPRKPLLDIGGVPMVVRVADRARKSGASRVVVATDSNEVRDVCARHGVEALMTSPAHPTGTDRLAEAVGLLELADSTIVVNIQGDEPLLPTVVPHKVAALLEARPDCDLATAAHALANAAEFFDPNVVKVVLDARGRALFFSRAPIPWSRDAFAESRALIPPTLPALRHIGLYAYRASFLLRYPSLPAVAIEQHEKLEQLRALAHGVGIAVLTLEGALPPGVDTEAELALVRAMVADETS